MRPCARRLLSAVRTPCLRCTARGWFYACCLLPAASRPQDVLGDKGRRIRELTAVVQKRFGFADNAVELFAERVANRGLSAQAQAESLKFKLLGGLAVRRACYGIVKFVMEAGAKGVEVVVAGKLRGQRAKAMKFRDGYMVKSGHSAVIYNDYATRHVMMRQGIMGVRVKIMLPHDATGQEGIKKPLSDVVEILQPKGADLHGPAESRFKAPAPAPQAAYSAPPQAAYADPAAYQYGAQPAYRA